MTTAIPLSSLSTRVLESFRSEVAKWDESLFAGHLEDALLNELIRRQRVQAGMAPGPEVVFEPPFFSDRQLADAAFMGLSESVTFLAMAAIGAALREETELAKELNSAADFVLRLQKIIHSQCDLLADAEKRPAN